ncbi:XRE family transcriptional regulator [Uliginosibacterium paludis]|uniref:XRE family transcriptional regulator n=1 Tax=Uliginosibacterium paludis TaxID=1615952 RepID=A0ABV2CMN4_9RHOO
MNIEFNGTNLKLARQCQGLSLNEVGDAVEKSRQYIHRVEMGRDQPTPDLIRGLAKFLNVAPEFFFERSGVMLCDDAYHFRKLASTPVTMKQAAQAKGELFRRFVAFIDQKLRLPECNFPSFEVSSPDDIERAAERCRSLWELGLGPIDNVIRVAENAGAVVTTFHDVSEKVDALSISSQRPIIVTNNSKGSACRVRFDLAHEIGHFVMHESQLTGDRTTESEANRFAGAFLLPRGTFVKAFPKLKGSSLNWPGIVQLKMEWKVSKAAILYRARQLGLITESQYKSGIIYGLNRKGQATSEDEDKLIPFEKPELIYNALKILRTQLGLSSFDVAENVHMKMELLRHFLPDLDGEIKEDFSRLGKVFDLEKIRRARALAS